MKKKKLVIIDAFDFLHRAYYVIPKTITTREGVSANAVYGFTSMLISLLDRLDPDYLVVAMEGGAPTFRVEEFKAYKATRKKDEEKDRAFEEQVPIVKEVLEAFDVPYHFFPGYEADDVIGTITAIAEGEEGFDRPEGEVIESLVVTNDQDMLQLVDEDTKVLMPKRGAKEEEVYTPEKVIEKYGFVPKKIITYKALQGDSSDNIPGVRGIGKKTAANLLDDYDSLEEIYKNLDKLPKRTANLLTEGYEEAQLSKMLATIKRDVPIEFDLKKCRFRQVDKADAAKKMKELGFKSLYKRLTGEEMSASAKKEENSNQLGLL